MASLVIPAHVVDHIVSGKAASAARMVVKNFGPPDNNCLVVMVNDGGAYYWFEAFMEAAMLFKNRGQPGDQDKYEAIKAFFEEIKTAVHGQAPLA